MPPNVFSISWMTWGLCFSSLIYVFNSIKGLIMSITSELEKLFNNLSAITKANPITVPVYTGFPKISNLEFTCGAKRSQVKRLVGFDFLLG